MHTNFTTGLSCELLVASAYAAQGWAVYWPLHTQSRCDFLVEKEGDVRKVQVKKASWASVGAYKYLQCRLKSRNKHSCEYREGDWDEVVFVDDSQRMWRASWDEVKTLVSVCLDGTKPGYKTRSKLYDPTRWEWRNED